MSHLTQQQIENMTIERAKLINGVWHILVFDDEKIGYPISFEGFESDTDLEIIQKAQEVLSHMEHKTNSITSSVSTTRETIVGSNIITP
jgi:hypothetical protein